MVIKDNKAIGTEMNSAITLNLSLGHFAEL